MTINLKITKGNRIYFSMTYEICNCFKLRILNGGEWVTLHSSVFSCSQLYGLPKRSHPEEMYEVKKLRFALRSI